MTNSPELDELLSRLNGYMNIHADYTNRISNLKDEIYNFMNDNNIKHYKTDKLSLSFRGKSLIVTHVPKEVGNAQAN